MIDVIIPPSVFAKYMQLVKPFLSGKPQPQENPTISRKNVSSPFISITNLRNEFLPLLYLEFKGFRLMLPVASGTTQESHHDLLMLQVHFYLNHCDVHNFNCRKKYK